MNRMKCVKVSCIVLHLILTGCSGGEDVSGKYNDGVRAFNEKRLEDAVMHFNSVIDSDDGFLNAYLMLAKIHYYNGDYQGTVKLLDRIIERDPDHTGALYWRARALIMSGTEKNEEPVALLKKVLESDSSHIPARLLLSLLYEKNGNHREAIHEYLTILAEEENLVSARGNLAILYMRLGMADRARSEIEKAEKIAVITGHGVKSINVIKGEFEKWEGK